MDAQTAINQQILAQLSHIGQHLSKLEKGDCKKSDDLTKIKNRRARTRSKATTKSINKSTESTDPVNSLCTHTGVPLLADIRQNGNIQQKVD